jgi:hypothetical protein
LQQQQQEEVMNFLYPIKAPTSSCLSPFGRSTTTTSSTNKILCSILIKASSGSWMEDEIDQLPFPPTPYSSHNPKPVTTWQLLSIKDCSSSGFCLSTTM